MPLRYIGKAVGMAAYERAVGAECERVRNIGLQNRKNVADPKKRSPPGQCYHHCDPGVNPYQVLSRCRRCCSLLFY